MNTSSRKAKGRRLQQEVRDALRSKYDDVLVDDDIQSIGMGQSGADIVLSPLAKKHIPIDIECKAQESLNIWSALSQAESNSTADRVPVVVFKRNRSKTYICMEFDAFIDKFLKK